MGGGGQAVPRYLERPSQEPPGHRELQPDRLHSTWEGSSFSLARVAPSRGALRDGPRVDGASPGLDATICLRGWVTCPFSRRASQPRHEFALSALGKDSGVGPLASQPLQENRRPGWAGSPRIPWNPF